MSLQFGESLIFDRGAPRDGFGVFENGLFFRIEGPALRPTADVGDLLLGDTD